LLRYLYLNEMLKQYLSVIFLSLSTLMMLGHSIFPHHHHIHSEDSSFHRNFHQISGTGIEAGNHHDLLDNIFSLVPHAQKGVECISCPNMDETFNKQYFTFIAIVPRYFGINLPLFVSEKYFFGKPDTLFISSYFPPGGLRAPPIYS